MIGLSTARVTEPFFFVLTVRAFFATIQKGYIERKLMAKKRDEEYPPRPFFVSAFDEGFSRGRRVVFVWSRLRRIGSSHAEERKYGMDIKTGKMFLCRIRGVKYAKLSKKESDAMWGAAARRLTKLRDEEIHPQMDFFKKRAWQ